MELNLQMFVNNCSDFYRMLQRSDILMRVLLKILSSSIQMQMLEYFKNINSTWNFVEISQTYAVYLRKNLQTIGPSSFCKWKGRGGLGPSVPVGRQRRRRVPRRQPASLSALELWNSAILEGSLSAVSKPMFAGWGWKEENSEQQWGLRTPRR